MTHSELNIAIYKVLTTQFKKDAKEAHEAVKAAGYEITKNGGRFEVYNPDTNRWLYIADNGWRGCRIIHGHYTRQMRIFNSRSAEEILKFDFVGCLEKPTNEAYYKMIREAEQRSNAKQKYERLKSARWYVKYETEKLESVQKKIEELQKELILSAQAKVKYEQKLQECRRELGLI